jgi:hypothetical protein
MVAEFLLIRTITWSLASMVVTNNKVYGNKKTRQTLAILITMRIQGCNAIRIAQWSTFQASLEATVCRHRARAYSVLPQGPPWLTVSNKYIASVAIMVDGF